MPGSGDREVRILHSKSTLYRPRTLSARNGPAWVGACRPAGGAGYVDRRCVCCLADGRPPLLHRTLALPPLRFYLSHRRLTSVDEQSIAFAAALAAFTS